jgi:NAD dependent epimerase/dehydratase
MSGLAGRRVLVTGADGFIGSHVVETALAEGAVVKAFCLYNSFGSAGWLDQSEAFSTARTEQRADLALGDIRDAEFVSAAVEDVDVVLHLAALIAIPYSYLAPRSYVDTNITGTLNVLEAVRRHGTTRLVHTSTSEVYGTPETVPITETHALRGQSPYSASKIAADKMCEAFALSFGTPVVVLRPFNTYGPRQSRRAVIPTVLGQLLSGASQLRLGALSPRRDFTFVADTCAGFMSAATADLAPGETVQLGSGTTYSIGEVVDLCMRVTDRRAEIVTDEIRIRPADSEVQVLLSDPSKARARLGWEPTVSLEDGLRRTAQWLTPRLDAAAAAGYQR